MISFLFIFAGRYHHPRNDVLRIEMRLHELSFQELNVYVYGGVLLKLCDQPPSTAKSNFSRSMNYKVETFCPGRLAGADLLNSISEVPSALTVRRKDTKFGLRISCFKLESFCKILANFV